MVFMVLRVINDPLQLLVWQVGQRQDMFEVARFYHPHVEYVNASIYELFMQVYQEFNAVHNAKSSPVILSIVVSDK
jgi:hypothetical protein